MPKITNEGIFEIQPYKSIIEMMKAFKDKTLKPMDFRYELGVETEDKKEVYRAGLKIKDSKGHATLEARKIEDKLKQNRNIYENKIKKQCIMNSSRLLEKLSVLKKKGIIEHNVDGYRLCKTTLNDIIAEIDKNNIDISTDSIEQRKNIHLYNFYLDLIKKSEEESIKYLKKKKI